MTDIRMGEIHDAIQVSIKIHRDSREPVEPLVGRFVRFKKNLIKLFGKGVMIESTLEENPHFNDQEIEVSIPVPKK
jgi:hypothetical protein